MSTGAATRMSPGKNSQKSVTPESVKALMIVEACIVGFLSYWIYSEYQYNIYFKQYFDTEILQHLTTYTVILGLGIGLTGSAVAATLYRNLQHAKTRLETVAIPKIKGTVERIIASMPTIDEHVSLKGGYTGAMPTESGPTQTVNNTTTPSPVVPSIDQKKPV
jgi:hypothetical protein